MEIFDDKKDNKEQEVADNLSEPGPPHEGMFLILAHLPLFELLAMTEVCKSLNEAIDSDILPWLNIFVEKPLNSHVSNHILMKITSKANGRLQSLGLIDCLQVTDDGLLAVIEKNPLINKLYVPRCTGLTPEGVIRAVQMLPKHSLKPICLKINGIYNMNKEHLETLRSLIQLNQTQQNQFCNFYHNKHKHYSTFRQKDETNPSIDIDICPKCIEVGMVYDCSQQTCRRKREKLMSECRGCYLCIPRCEECGRCVDSEEQDDFETACADILCAECSLQAAKCNFCNKPYCNEHADRMCKIPGVSGFLCEVCHSKFMEASTY